MPSTDLICGCRTCGCTCEEHAVHIEQRLCARHFAETVARRAARDLLEIVALSLFLGCITVWAAIIAGA